MKKYIKKSAIAIALATLPMAAAQAAGGNNHVAVFAGATDTYLGTNPTFGIEYEYLTPLWNKKIGIGLVAERIFDSGHEANILVAGAVIHPWMGLKLNLSGGVEFVDSKTKNVARAGVGYDFHYNSISYGPVYNFDRIDGHNAHVAGIAIGFGF
ncbi:MAG: hypothetical protein OEM38_06185 [Gammaproteobacteria bacterium]|nr:hypothetical protein [Gammaproteobacteria bacterium]